MRTLVGLDEETLWEQGVYKHDFSLKRLTSQGDRSEMSAQSQDTVTVTRTT